MVGVVIVVMMIVDMVVVVVVIGELKIKDTFSVCPEPRGISVAHRNQCQRRLGLGSSSRSFLFLSLVK